MFYKIKKFKDSIILIYKATVQSKKFNIGYYLILRFMFDVLFVNTINMIKFKKLDINFFKYVNKNYNITYNWFNGKTHIWFFFIKKFKFLNKNIKVLELGSFEGLSIVFLFYLFNKKLVIDSVDIINKNSKYYRNFLYNTKKINNLTFYNVWTKKFFNKKNNKKYNLIHIDASHYYRDVFFDAKKSFELLKKDGLMIFDDVVHNWTKKRPKYQGHTEFHNVVGGVLLFLEYVKTKKYKIKILYVGTILILQKKSI